MKFTLSWLKHFLDTDASPEAIGNALTSLGLEVESITDQGAALAPFTVAEIKEAVKHPDADKLRVCQVLTDEGMKQIVCGAPNARAGIKVALAKPGAIIPNGGFEIKPSKIRGVESNGMLCSARELNLGDDHAGIIELPEDAVVGAPVAAALGLNDPLFDIAITPNRGDCLGVYGVARDLAASGIGTLKPLQTVSFAEKEDASPLSIRIEDTEGCSFFSGRVIRGVKNGASPEWLQQWLKAIGLRPISVLVDITNYFTISYGRPLHVFDLAKLQGGIVVRDAKPGETLAALNDKSYTLAPGMVVVGDESGRALGLGGIVGGTETGVTESTTDILLECAQFNPVRIAKAGRALGIDTDARHRFERMVDTGFAVQAERLATAMILELCGGTASEAVTAGSTVQEATRITLRPDFVQRWGGVALPLEEITSILASLGFTCTPALDNLDVTVPSWRTDVAQEADLVEEILRVHGYDNIAAPSLPKSESVSRPALSLSQRRLPLLRRALAQRGLMECHTWSFLSEADAASFGATNPDLHLANPISDELRVMRPSLVPNLLHALQRNLDRGATNVALFELGPQFIDTTAQGQQLIACALRGGDAMSTQWSGKSRNIDAFDAKADAFAILETCGFDTGKAQLGKNVPGWYHPGRSAAITLGPKVTLGHFGELHPALLRRFGIDVPVVACEILVDAVPLPKARARKAVTLSDYQSVERDFAFLTDRATGAGDLLKAVQQADALITEVKLFDLYEGDKLPEGKKSLAITTRLQATDRTLTEAEIDAVAKKIIAAAAKIGASLRS